MPPEAAAEYEALKSARQSNSSPAAVKYWEECCRRMGMIDAADGIRLRNGRFEDDGSYVSPEFGMSAPSGSMNATRRWLAVVQRTCAVPSSEVEDKSETGRISDIVSDNTAIAGSISHELQVHTSSDKEGILARYKSPENESAAGNDKRIDGRSSKLDNSSVPQVHPSASVVQAEVQICNIPSTLETNCNADVSRSADDCPPTFGEDSKLDMSLRKCENEHRKSPMTNDLILEKVGLALNMVEVSLGIRPMPTTEEATEKSLMSSRDLAGVGEGLYELFSGRTPYGCDMNGEANGDSLSGVEPRSSDESTSQQRKKEKQSSTSGFVPLVNFGLPPVLCSLVSSLLWSSDGSLSTHYESLSEVKEELHLIASEPEKFLVNASMGFLPIPAGRLYGRDKESDSLLAAYQRVKDPSNKQAREVVLLSGNSGTGKSSVVQNMRSRFNELGACFVSGKFDRMQQCQPLSAIVKAIDDYCGLLALDTDRIDGVRKALSSALGREGTSLLASLIPNMVKVLNTTGTSVPAVHVDGREALQRLIFMIRILFQATCSFDHPLILFLDDIHWADEVSLLMMQALISDASINGLLLLGCYRSDEVGADHLLMKHLANIRHLGIRISILCIGNLDLETVNSMLSDTFHLTPRMTRELAEVVLRKTDGNAFFLVQFLASLRDEGLLRFSLVSKRWEWEIVKLCDREIEDNVAELMTAKLLKMAPEVLDALKVAAAFGAQCQEELLTIIDKAPGRVGSISCALDVAVAEGIMGRVGSAYRFAHDQIQQSAYFLIPEPERNAFHLQIGKLLWKCSSQDELDTYLFIIVDQLHRGSGLIAEHDEKIALAELSLRAGEMASEMSAYLPTSAYLSAGISLLTEDDWNLNRDLCLNLHNLCAETDYTLGNFDSMQCHLDKLLTKGRTLQEKTRAYYTLVQALGAQGRTLDAINTASAILNQLGEPLPVAETESTIQKEIGAAMCALASTKEDLLTYSKIMENEVKRHVVKFLHLLLLFLYNDMKSSLPVPVCRIVRLSLSHGFCKESALGFAFYGLIQCTVLRNYSEGYLYGKLALNIIKKFDAQEHLAKVSCVVYGVINHYVEPVQSCLPPLKRAIEVGLATGDTQYAMVAAYAHEGISLSSGESLDQLAKGSKAHSELMVECKQNYIYVMSKPTRQAMLNLIGRSPDPTKLVGEVMDEDSFRSEASDHVLFMIDSYRMFLEYLFGEYELAWHTAENNKEIGKKSARALMCFLCPNVFILCLTAIALARKEGERKYAAVINKTMSEMEEWAKQVPWNCQNKLELMRAEYAYLKGNTILAASCFDNAVDLAAKHHFTHEQGLALERCGIFHMDIGNHATAAGVLKRAQDCYKQWGALSKVAHLEEQYL